jgi:DNA-binding transcriptional LysR family regulator
MDINLLKTYLEVARTRHFGRAAKNLCVTQSAVSARIKLLESLLGIDLFSRGRNNITLTAAGERLRRHAETVVRGWERARLEIAADADTSIAFSLGTTPDLWKIHGANWCTELLNHRELALRVELLSSRHLLERLQEGTLDAALITTPRHDAGLDSRHLFDYRLRAYATRPAMELERTMDGGDYLLIDWGSDFLSRHAERFDQLNPPRLQTTSCIAALDLLFAQGGCAYIAEPMAREWLAAGRLHTVAEAPSFEQSIYLVYRASLAQRPELQAIIGTE